MRASARVRASVGRSSPVIWFSETALPQVLGEEEPIGIVIQDGREPVPAPKVRAFIYGGEIRQQPTLPFGRWKEAAAS